MDAKIARQFWMKCTRPATPFANQDRRAIDGQERLDAGTKLREPRRADENAFEIGPIVGERLLCLRDDLGERNERIELRSVGIALSGEVDEAQGRDSVIDRLAREQDRTGAGAENGRNLPTRSTASLWW